MSGIVRYNRTRTSGLVKTVSGVPAVAGDKSPASSGDIWYNSSSNTLRCYIPVAAWSAGGALSGVRRSAMGFGTLGAAAVAGGNHPALGTTEEYNGTSWGSGGDTNTDAHGAGQGGLQTAGIKSSGYTSDYQAGSETYDGSAWSSITNLPVNRYEAGALGTQTAYGTFGGAVESGGSSTSDTMNIWNGSSWAAGGTLNAPSHHPVGCGTTTAGLRVGGLYPTSTTVNVVEEYNGTDWTTVTSYPTTITHAPIAGLQTDALVVSGKTNNATSVVTDDCYSYDGTNWTQTHRI